MESGSTQTKRLKNEQNRPPEVTGMLSRPIIGLAGKPPKLCAQKAKKFPELLGGGDAPCV